MSSSSDEAQLNINGSAESSNSYMSSSGEEEDDEEPHPSRPISVIQQNYQNNQQPSLSASSGALLSTAQPFKIKRKWEMTEAESVKQRRRTQSSESDGTSSYSGIDLSLQSGTQPNQQQTSSCSGYASTMSFNQSSYEYESGEQSTPDSNNEPHAKKIKQEWGNKYSSGVMRIMQKMGFDGKKGLGKQGQGILEPIEATRQEGRRGLGLRLEGLDAAAVEWDAELEEVHIPEEVIWLKSELDDLYDITMTDLDDWEVIGKRKLSLDDETRFCDPQVLANVISSKTVFDKVGEEDMRKARTRSNPFETIRGNIFLNRAAVKMANIDSMCDFMFTNPVDEKGESLIRNNDLLFFADICAGPGGFSEYILYRKQWEAKGFGFTLKDSNDFDLKNFYAGPPETFDAYYGIKGDGNIYDPENIETFKDYVLKQTDGSGVHFVMADGGFSVKGQENIQEILSKQLYLCQCLVALSILREKGHFVVKLFDLFTPFSVSLVYLMYKCFQEICICKPNTSRPANSERYLICKWKKPQTSIIERHLHHINGKLWKPEDPPNETMEIVRHEELLKDEKFCQYITESNNKLGKAQIIGLLKIAAFCKNTSLSESRQGEFKWNCLRLWKLPDEVRKLPDVPLMPNEQLLDELLKDWSTDKRFMLRSPEDLSGSVELRKYFHSIYDYSFIPIGREESGNVRTFFMAKGSLNVLMYGANGSWQPIRNCSLEMTPKTLVYGEIVTELIGEGRSQNKITALHIIDGLCLGGRDIRRYPLKERLKLCEKFARALNKPYKYNSDGSQPPMAPIRSKTLFAFTDFNSFFDQMRLYRLKDGNERLGYRIRTNDSMQPERFFVPGGLQFVNKHHPLYSCHWSRKHNSKYFFNLETKHSFYIAEQPAQFQRQVFGSFRSCFMSRKEWKWVNIHQVNEFVKETDRDRSLLYRIDFNEFLQKTCNPQQ